MNGTGQTLAKEEKAAPLRRRIWLFLWAFLIPTLIVPQTREMHVLITRLLFHLNLNGKTCVQGHPLRDLSWDVPTVEFTERARSNMIASAQLSPDAFLLATFLTYGPLDPPLPPASAWKDCPVVEWSALAIAGRIPFGYSSSHRTNDPVVLRDSLEVVRVAQQAHPQNGALWLAEARLRFMLDEDGQAIQALQTSLQKGHWNRQIGPAFLHVRKLLEAQGLPRLDASLKADVDVMILSLIPRLLGYIERSMISAVTSGDDARFRALVSLVIQLQQQQWEDKNVTTYLSSLPYPAYRPGKHLLDAMAKRLGRPIPDFRNAKYTEAQAVVRTILRDYLDAYAGPELANNLQRSNEIVAQQLEKKKFFSAEDSRHVTWLMLGSHVCGSLCLCMFALFLAAFVTNTAFILIPVNPFSMTTLLRNLRFWLLSIVAFTASTWLFTSLFEAVDLQVGSPGPTEVDYWINSFWDHATVARTFWLVWFVLKICWHWKVKPPRWFPSSLASLGFVYLVAVCFSAWVRFEHVQWVASTFLP